jgi:hypothetical protein
MFLDTNEISFTTNLSSPLLTSWNRFLLPFPKFCENLFSLIAVQKGGKFVPAISMTKFSGAKSDTS